MISSTIAKTHHTILGILAVRANDGKTIAFLREFFSFGYKEAISCLFPVFIFLMLAVSKFATPPGLYRYDFLLLCCIFMQVVMVRSGLENTRELLVVCVFHFLGICMEMFKVSHGAWSYPEPGYTKLMGVPLYSGFMYASVASYICQAWHHFDMKIVAWPTLPQSSSLSVAIYGNFFSNQFVYDLRALLIPVLFLMFRDTKVLFNTNGQFRQMPLSLGFLLIAFFVWLAENIGTFLGAWQYPHQTTEWSMVRLRLISSWFLLVVVSVVIVFTLKRIHRPESFLEAYSKSSKAKAGS